MSIDIASQFIEKIATPEGQAKAAEMGGKFIYDRLRERAFSRPILNALPITRDKCQISETHDTLIKLEFIEPGARAMPIAFRSTPDVEFIRMARCAVSFHSIASPVFTKTEQELMIYGDIPITKIIEDNSLKDIEEMEDRGFLIFIESAVQALQAEANNVGAAPVLNASALNGATPPVEFSVVKGELARQQSTDTAAPFPLQRPDVVTLRNLLTDNRLRGAQMLLTESDANTVDAWTLEDMGDKMQSETMVDGYKGNTLLGLKYVKSIKNDMLRRGNVYLFTAPEFLGKFYILNQTRFYVDKRYNVISWMAWEDIGMLIANVASVKKLELYSADATLNDDDSLRSNFIPKPVKDLFKQNNRVDAGVRFPAVPASF